MIDALSSVHLKIQRAETHLKSLAEILSPFMHCEVEILREKDEHRDDYLHLRVVLPKPDPGIHTIIGDCLYNLRSPLDHLVHQLVRANGNKPRTSNMFPISDTPGGFIRQLKYDRLCGVAVKAKNMIEAFQPYKLNPANPTAEPIWILSELMNIDKHRALTTTTTIATDMLATFGGHALDAWVIGKHGGFSMSGGRYRDGDLILSTAGDALGGERNIRGRATVAVVFQEPVAMDCDVRATFQEILEFVRDILVPAFKPLFRKPLDSVR